MRWSGCLGFLLLAVSLLAIASGIGDIVVSVPAIALVLPLVFAIWLLSYGVVGLARGLLGLVALVWSPAATRWSVGPACVVKGMIADLYAAGGIFAYAGLVRALSDAQDTAALLKGIAVASVPLFWFAVVAEFLFRPCLHRLRQEQGTEQEEE